MFDATIREAQVPRPWRWAGSAGSWEYCGPGAAGALFVDGIQPDAEERSKFALVEE